MKNLFLIFILLCFFGHSSLFAQDKCAMLYYDEFNDNSWYWPIKENSRQFSQNISDGYYYLESFKKKRAWTATKSHFIEIDENKNFEIEASIKKISTVEKRSGSGIIYGSDGKNWFCFAINDDGKYTFVKKTGGTTEKIIPWTESTYINQGMGSTNKLTIKKEGDKIKLYLNVNFLSETPFQSLFGNRTGFYISREQKIGVDYFRFTYMPKDTQ